MYDKDTAYVVCHDMADIMQGCIDDIIDMVMADGSYNNDTVEILAKYIQDRNTYLS